MATTNQMMNVRVYSLQFKQLLQAVFGKQAYFRDFFGGSIEALDGISDTKKAFTVKTSDIPVAINEYSTDKNTAFGTGTANTTRFGNRKEIIYTDTDVEYSWNWAFHEGIDRFTVNNDFNAAVADRLDLQAQEKVAQFNKHHGKFISDSAGKTLKLATQDAAGVLALFNEAHKYFVNSEVKSNLAWTAKVTPDVWNLIVDQPLTTTGKHSTVNIDTNGVARYKGFVIQEVPEALFQENEVAYFYPVGVGMAFTGINTARTIESEDFDGVALQGAGKAGEFILDDNKKAVGRAFTGGRIEIFEEFPIDAIFPQVQDLLIKAFGTTQEETKHSKKKTVGR